MTAESPVDTVDVEALQASIITKIDRRLVGAVEDSVSQFILKIDTPMLSDDEFGVLVVALSNHYTLCPIVYSVRVSQLRYERLKTGYLNIVVSLPSCLAIGRPWVPAS